MTVQQAAAVMNVSEQFIRIGIQKCTLDIGACVRLGKSKRHTYLVIDTKVAKLLGISREELERRVKKIEKRQSHRDSTNSDNHDSDDSTLYVDSLTACEC